MKSKFKIIAVLFILIISAVILPKQTVAQQSNVSFQIFYDQLSPYGQWVDYSNYGYVWIPDVGDDFVPYSTAGHWILTYYGWTWVSDYNWGWAPFHYGRWDYDNYYGWFWVPDNEWGPSWVNWRRADGYYGWAPMRPGISIGISFGHEYDGRNDHWSFVRDRDIDRPNVSRYYVNGNDRDRIVINSTVINKTYIDNRRNTTYITGPAREDVQRATGRRFNPVAIQENTKPGQSMSNGRLRIYRPEVNKNDNDARRPIPSKIVNIKDVKRPMERTRNQPQNGIPNTINNREQQQNRINQQLNNNNPTSVQPQNANPYQNGRQVGVPQKVVTQPNRAVRPIQPQNAIPNQNSRRFQQQQPVSPQPNNNNARPVQPQNANPVQNIPNVQQSKQQPTRPQTIRNNTRPVQPQNAIPVQNKRSVEQPQKQQVISQPRNNNVRPVQPQNVNPAQNNKREQPTTVVKPSNNKKKEEPSEHK